MTVRVWMVFGLALLWSTVPPCLGQRSARAVESHGAFIRGDTTKRSIALMFSGHEFGESGELIATVLRRHRVKASFFFTGDFYRNASFAPLIRILRADGHYLGPHSDRHLLYASWERRDSTLVTREQFTRDVWDNYSAMRPFGIGNREARYFLPPYEWYNREIARWCVDSGIVLVNFTAGTYSNADYTTPDMGSRYVSSDSIFQRILRFEAESPSGLNGFLLLLHVGTHPSRTDKMASKLEALIVELHRRGYRWVRTDEMVGTAKK